jgi:RimJ/RimL family protein N-acetyltransferase
MIDIEKIDIERLRNPEPFFKILEPSEKVLDEIVDKMYNGYLYFSDEFRYPEYLKALVYNIYSKESFNLVYEVGKFQGIVGFMNIAFDRKCDMMLKLWDGSIWKPDLVGQGRRLIHYIVDTFGLVRVGTATADDRIVRMAKLVGFEEEGVRKKAFYWEGKPMDEILLSITRG